MEMDPLPGQEVISPHQVCRGRHCTPDAVCVQPYIERPIETALAGRVQSPIMSVYSHI